MEKNIIDAEVINKKDVPPDVEKRRLTDQYGPLIFVPKDEEVRDSYSETRSIFDEYRKARLGTLPEDVTAETFISAVTLDFAGYEDYLRWGVSGAIIEKNTNEGLVTISLAPGKREWIIKMKRPGHTEEYSYRPFEGDNEESIDDYGNIKPLGGKVRDLVEHLKKKHPSDVERAEMDKKKAQQERSRIVSEVGEETTKIKAEIRSRVGEVAAKKPWWIERPDTTTKAVERVDEVPLKPVKKWWQETPVTDREGGLHTRAATVDILADPPPRKWYQKRPAGEVGQNPDPSTANADIKATPSLNAGDIARGKGGTDLSPETVFEGGRTAYYNYLKDLQKRENPFPTSDAPPNPLIDGIRDENQLYPFYVEELKDYSNSQPTVSDKVDVPPDGFVGNKLHLNVEPKDIVTVSDYLTKEKFWHKYLHGGEIVDGKIFTVYIGSTTLARKLALKISRDLRPYLRKPVTEEEIEYAPNVCGRFQGGLGDFEQYGLGLRGISMLRSWAKKINYWAPKLEKQKLLPLAFDETYNAMADKYGEYFYGSPE